MASVTSPGGDLAAFERRLSTADRYRAARFHRPVDLARFIAGRALLAQLLQEELDYQPATLELALTRNGRPYLPGQNDIHFSISHAGDWVAVAFAVGAQVGIDLEALNRRIDLDALAERIFHADDLTRFRALPSASQVSSFFRAWTQKEAVLKAKGQGLFGGLQEIRVPLHDGPAVFIEGETKWQLEPLALPPGYVGTVAWDDPAKSFLVRLPDAAGKTFTAH